MGQAVLVALASDRSMGVSADEGAATNKMEFGGNSPSAGAKGDALRGSGRRSQSPLSATADTRLASAASGLAESVILRRYTRHSCRTALAAVDDAQERHRIVSQHDLAMT